LDVLQVDDAIPRVERQVLVHRQLEPERDLIARLPDHVAAVIRHLVVQRVLKDAAEFDVGRCEDVDHGVSLDLLDDAPIHPGGCRASDLDSQSA